jgi:hypothetical protein
MTPYVARAPRDIYREMLHIPCVTAAIGKRRRVAGCHLEEVYVRMNCEMLHCANRDVILAEGLCKGQTVSLLERIAEEIWKDMITGYMRRNALCWRLR